MKVKMLTSMGGTPRAAYGDIVDLPDPVARRLIAKGMAEAVTRSEARAAEVETAVGDPQRPGIVERALGRVFGRG